MKKIIIFIFVLLILIFSIFLYKENLKTIDNIGIDEIETKEECVIDYRVVTINGYSMSPFLESGEEVQALFNYYSCNDVLRNDVVLYKYSGKSNLLIKFIRAIPGDTWNLKKTNSGYEIIVNGISLLNSEGKLYLIPEGSTKMLELYARDYPVIPADAYLLLGDKIDGSMDSTSFGLVGKKDIMAKVEKK
ncbi:MAG: signal peptidase I [Candidatus Paceibacterota bacterium]